MAGNVIGADIVIMGLHAYVTGLQQNAESAAQEIAELLESYAKEHHPWKDDTGDTRASIKGQVSDISKEMIVVTLSAGTSYSEFLELCHSGKWAWLYPAVLANQDKIRAILKKWLGNASVRRF